MNQTTDATTIFAPLWRRKWLILAVGIIVAAASYAYYKRQRPTYQSSTQIYLGAGLEEAAPGEKASAKGQTASILDQAAVINSIVVENVHKQLKAEHRLALVRGTVIRAKGAEKGQFVTITSEAHTAKGAALIANLTARSYIRRQRVEHRRVIEKALAISRRQLRRIEAANAPRPAATTGSSTTAKKSASPSTASILQAASLNSKINQLESSLFVAGAQQVKPAKAATALQLSPKPRQDAIFGFVLGLVLAAIAAYILSRFDRRLRTLAGIEQVFATQILAALPKAGHAVTHRDGQPAPSRQLLEPLRRLHTALQLGDKLGPDPATPRRVILFISPDAGDGKSTIVADLAMTQRDGGQRVAVVEANFRRPVQAELLDLQGASGLAEALAGTVPVGEVMQRVLPLQPADGGETQPAGGTLTAVESRAGSLFVLCGGLGVANPPALLGHAAMAELLRAVAVDFDYVLIDAPSPLEVSDVMPLLKLVDGLVIVARVGHTREASAQRLVQLLAHTECAPLLGAVANCVAQGDTERYGFASPNGRAWPLRLIGR
jgi:Mrp family chromosome partitioning ATPase